MKKLLTIQDTIDLGFSYGYQEYGGECTAFGIYNKDEGIAINFNEHYSTEYPFLEIHKTEYDKITRTFKGEVKTKKDFIRLLEQLDIK